MIPLDGPSVPDLARGGPTLRSEPPAAPPAPPCVLVADDEPLVLEVIRQMILALGGRPLTATCGDDAVRLFQSHADDVRCVLLDRCMPGGGDAAGRAIQALRPGARIVIMSGTGGRGGELGKPFLLGELAAALDLPLAARRSA